MSEEVRDGAGNLLLTGAPPMQVNDRKKTAVDDVITVAGADLTALGTALRAEDSASADGDKGIVLFAIRKATPADLSGAEGDYEALQIKGGRLWASVLNEAGELHLGEVGSRIATPSAGALTRPSDTNAYAIDDLIASSTTAGSIVVPSFTASRIATGTGMIRRVRMVTNHTTAIGAVTLEVGIWSAAPTYTNGDNGAYAVATGAANYLGTFSVMLVQHADGAVGNGVPLVGSEINFALASGSTLFWDLKTKTAFTPQSGKTFTPIFEIHQN